MLFKVILFMFNNLKGCRWSLRLIAALFTLGSIQFLPSARINKDNSNQILVYAYMYPCKCAEIQTKKLKEETKWCGSYILSNIQTAIVIADPDWLCLYMYPSACVFM